MSHDRPLRALAVPAALPLVAACGRSRPSPRITIPAEREATGPHDMWPITAIGEAPGMPWEALGFRKPESQSPAE